MSETESDMTSLAGRAVAAVFRREKEEKLRAGVELLKRQALQRKRDAEESPRA
jgi:hypothetical protein